MNVGVRELRDRLSRHLADVRAGHTVTITDHGQPIARIVPIARPTRLDQLLAEGKVRPARRPKKSAPSPVQTKGPVSDLIAEQRRWRALIAYLDTSGLVPLLVAEPSSALCRRVWDDADAVVSCRLLYVETAAALAQAVRMDRLTVRQHNATVAALEDLWSQIDAVEIDDTLVRRAADLARRFGLRGYDAVHCAGAEQLSDPELVAVAGDRRLLDAWHQLGLATVDTNATDA